MTEITINSLMRITILILLYDSPYCGYELIQSTGRIIGTKSSTGSVYPFLHELIEKEYLTSEINKRSAKSKIIYSLTPKGKKLALQSAKKIKRIFEIFLGKCFDCKDEFINIEICKKMETLCIEDE